MQSAGPDLVSMTYTEKGDSCACPFLVLCLSCKFLSSMRQCVMICFWTVVT